MRRNTVLLGLRARLPNHTRHIQIRFGATSLGKIQTEHSLFLGVKYSEIIADNLSKSGWSWGCVSALDREGRTIWIVDAHRDTRRSKAGSVSGAGSGDSCLQKNKIEEIESKCGAIVTPSLDTGEG